MAESLDDGEYWLPPQFLADDEIFMEKKEVTVRKDTEAKDVLHSVTEISGKPLIPFEFPYGIGSFNGFSSGLGSPDESVVGSTETESDEEDYLAGLTRQMAHFSHGNEFRGDGATFGTESAKGRIVSGSPQSTQFAIRNGCGCRQGSGQESPDGPLRVNSSSATWDLLHAAAGEMVKLSMNQESHGFNHNSNNQIYWDQPRKHPSLVSLPMENSLSSDDRIYQKTSMSYLKLQESQFQQLRHRQMIKQQQIADVARIRQVLQNQTVIHNNRGRNTISPLGLSSSAWPPLQQTHAQPERKPGPDMLTTFVGNPGPKRKSTGTGVFLPRRASPPIETRKKPGCSTVLLPARVVQALNVKLDGRSCPQQRYPSRISGSFNAGGDAALFRLRDDNYLSHQEHDVLRSQPIMMNDNEVRLPQEWTY